jgi:hypothetical protein
MQQKVYYKWNDLNILWSLVDMPWNDVFYLIEIGEALGGGFPGFAGPGFGGPHKYNAPAELVKSKLKPEQYSVFIKILCKVNCIKSEEMKRRKVSNLPEISVIEINRTMEEVFKPIVRLKKVFRSDI